MEKLKAYIGLKLVNIGLWILEQEDDFTWDKTDKEMADKLRKYQTEFKETLNERN